MVFRADRVKRPLRIAALVVLLASIAVTLWLYFVPLQAAEDPYYAAAKTRQALPFAAVTGVVGLLVFVAGGTARSYRRWAAIALWLILFGAVFLVVSLLGELGPWAARPLRYSAVSQAYVTQMRMQMLGLGVGGLSLLAGGVLWLLSYRLDRARSD